MMPETGSYYGYIEGYYGKLLSFADRGRILKQLNQLGMNSYFYAPKDDPYHRFHWRQPYPEAWWLEWHDFIAAARDLGITVIAGLAPGLDLNFDFNLDEDAANSDIAVLAEKLARLAGDDHVIPCLLLDDIPPASADNHGRHDHEGRNHAKLANRLSDHLRRPVMVTPRVYADELEMATPGYLSGFVHTWDGQREVFYCGHHIVAHDTMWSDTALIKAGLPESRLIIWDNLYANDYCPRRLFLGQWGGEGRQPQHLQQTAGIMLNPTGMIETDMLLLSIMAAGDDTANHQATLRSYGVPEAFDLIKHSFNLPPSPSGETSSLDLDDTAAMLDALDELLWRWKSPLAQEWYPFLMGLRGDILMLRGEADDLRQAKIIPPYLRHYIKGQPTS
jgi:protein O-GlcNAcase/histone acetyltransferase